MDRPLGTAIAVVITCAWAISFVVDIINPKYEPPASVHALMMIIAGAFFGGALMDRRAKEP